MTARTGIIAQLADPQLGFQDYDGELARLHREIDILNAGDCQCAVICGDLYHDSSSDSQRNAFLAELERLKIPCHVVRGNHDDDMPRFIQDFGPAFYASELPFDGYRLVVLDTNCWMDGSCAEAKKMDALLIEEMEDALASGRRLILAGHNPIFTEAPDENGDYFSLPIGRRVWLGELFRKYPVAAYLAGHTHTAFTCLWNGVLLSNCETTSVAFDNAHYGFRRFVFADGMIRFNTIPVDL